MDMYQALLLIFVIYILVYIIAQALGIEKLQEKGVEAGTPFFIMWKTERLNAFLTRMGKKFPKAFFNLGIVVAFGGMAIGFWLFGENLLRFFFMPETAGGVVPIIPGVTIQGPQLFYLLIGLAVTLLTHEFAHGLASAKDDIPIKGSGLVFFLVLFGGFVEPDEDVFEQEASPQARMRLLAAGSYANLIWALFFFLLLINVGPVLSLGYSPPSGAYIYDVAPDSAAFGNIEIGDVIVSLNGTDINTWADVSIFMADSLSNRTLTVQTLDTTFDITLGMNSVNHTRGYIGIYGADYWEPKIGFLDPMFPFHYQMTLQWTFLILFSVALFNLLPIPFLDGDKLLSNALSLRIKDERKLKYIMYPARIIAFLIVILSIVLTFLTGKVLF
ncbi:MAG: site-2 protease family protein [Candidatus Thorarchaeota archaeon]